MAYQTTYTHETQPTLVVFHPKAGAPFVPQFCYEGRGRAFVETCRAVNETVGHAYDALACTPPRVSESAPRFADAFARQLMGDLLRELGFACQGRSET